MTTVPRTRTAILAVAAFLAALASGQLEARAELITFSFAGVVEDVGDFGGALAGQVAPGDTFSGSYTFESTTPDERGELTFASYYFDNVPEQFSMRTEIGGLYWETVELDPFNFSSEIDVQNNSGLVVQRDAYRVFTRELGGNAVAAGEMASMDLEMITFESLDALTSTSLPLTPPDLMQFEIRNLTISATAPDCDSPYDCQYFIRGRLTSLTLGASPPPPTPTERLEDLLTLTVAINVQSGIASSLDSKLGAAIAALDDHNERNDVAATNALNAFINSVEAQRGRRISEADADALIAAAQAIIDQLAGAAP